MRFLIAVALGLLRLRTRVRHCAEHSDERERGRRAAGEVSAPDTITQDPQADEAARRLAGRRGVRRAATAGTGNFDYVYPTEREAFQYYADKRFSIIRLPFLWERVQPKPFGPLAHDEVAAIRAVLNHAASANQQVILDLHNCGRYYNEPMRSPTPVAWPTSG